MLVRKSVFPGEWVVRAISRSVWRFKRQANLGQLCRKLEQGSKLRTPILTFDKSICRTTKLPNGVIKLSRRIWSELSSSPWKDRSYPYLTEDYYPDRSWVGLARRAILFIDEVFNANSSSFGAANIYRPERSHFRQKIVVNYGNFRWNKQACSRITVEIAEPQRKDITGYECDRENDYIITNFKVWMKEYLYA